MMLEGRVKRTYIISTIVENRPGVLHKASNMFRCRGFNIDSISVGATERKDLSRMTITIRGDSATVEQLVKQLAKLIDVIKVSVLSPGSTVVRELALVKLYVADGRARSDIINYANVFRSRVVDVAPGSITVEVTGSPDKIDAFITLASTFGIKEIARTGITALVRG
ncbi:MAG: acetolactate synthase small subunit [Candidatus Methylarchaceae archaeon HK01B]|nr:acetolactate synthase small subunit [Candidatus Methylarchaceae archaeon HK01M]MCP8318541.1 acetolactate synthase small subunit [Candidatus Methylarchaceae archaeon HK01B]